MSPHLINESPESELEYRLQELQAQCFRAEELFLGYSDGLDDDDDDEP